MLSKWKEWIGAKSRAEGKRVAPRRLRPRLELEQLETRMVPAAIRMLPGFTANTLGPEDDLPSQSFTLPFTLNFFGLQTNQVFVNNNGNISFTQPNPGYTPTDLNSNNGGLPIIAPFFADVDTTGPGSGVVTYGTDTLCGLPVFGVDYINVGYYQAHVDKLNSFQVILIDRADVAPGDFDIEFNYNQIQWETGDANGGNDGLGGGNQSATVGYSNGTGTPGTFLELPGSHIPGSFIDGGPDALISTAIDASTPGRIHFSVRNGVVVTTPTAAVNNDVTAETRVFAPFRYITDDLATGLQEGNLTVVNFSAPVTTTTPSSAIDACLDLTDTTTMTTSSTTFPGPINVVFRSLPPGVTVVNPTGFTASGLAYITEPVAALPPNEPVLRVRINIANATAPTPTAPTTFFESALEGLEVQVFSGPFDPTML